MSEEISAADYEAMIDEDQRPSGFNEFAELMIHDPKIPLKAKKRFWGYLSKDTILAHILGGDRWGLQNNFVIQRNFDIMSKPAFEVNIEELKAYENIRNRFTMQVSRGIGGFERDRLAMQIREIRTNRMPQEQTTGFLGGLKKKLGFGPKKTEGEYGPGGN